jgi:hypothetical protein
MKNLTRLLLVATSLAGTAFAAPNFGGTWVRDAAKSEATSYPMFWTTRGVEAGGRVNGEFLLSIVQRAEKIEITDAQKPFRTLELDGKAHAVTTDTGLERAAVTAALQTDRLVVVTRQPYGGMPGNAMSSVEEIWTLSADGSVLTVDVTRESPATKQSYKQVFTRK